MGVWQDKEGQGSKERIRGTERVTEVSKMTRETRLRWCGGGGAKEEVTREEQLVWKCRRRRPKARWKVSSGYEKEGLG